jgi:hypothetical protein
MKTKLKKNYLKNEDEAQEKMWNLNLHAFNAFWHQRLGAWIWRLVFHLLEVHGGNLSLVANVKIFKFWRFINLWYWNINRPWLCDSVVDISLDRLYVGYLPNATTIIWTNFIIYIIISNVIYIYEWLLIIIYINGNLLPIVIIIIF